MQTQLKANYYCYSSTPLDRYASQVFPLKNTSFSHFSLEEGSKYEHYSVLHSY